MTTQIFVNLPVKSLPRAVEFFTALGYSFNPQFTDENGTCMIVADNIFVMLLTEPFFRTFTTTPICEPTKGREAIICLSAESRARVDEIVRLAVAAGGSAPIAPQDHGFMYQHGFHDIDGHQWEVVYLDPNAQPPQS